MASGLYFTLLLCLSCGLWNGTEAGFLIRAADGNDCPAGWSWYPSRCYLFVNVGKDWAEAERYCKALGGNLVSFHSSAEYNFVRNLISSKTGAQTTCWAGGSDAAKDGVWLWTDGSTFDFIGWHAGEPNNANGGESCMDFNVGGIDWVNDEKCTPSLPFVCAKNV